ncbi:hypothetical protein ANCDUO_02110 [Ancylostoma duodenale]|uniref:Mon2/Sec7/BIG1-like dimerisation and cyclophilin-binding domain-containing protein n=1 Tax=Ancylostoma duodenale TaxID=51022 RepID=A0A0C2HDD8_9BILA|nr:hypothetical protein ANCDUO_02110 [Ancylostoma duodenale]
MSLIAPLDARKLVEALLGDLRQLSTEAKKKHNHVKEVHASIVSVAMPTLDILPYSAAESGVVRVRNISTASGESNLLTNLRAASNELLHPLILACATRQTKLVQIALQSIQRLVQHRVLEASCANVVVSELWGLVEVECEELRVLQTVPPLVSADLLVTGNTLAKCIVMCFRMHFAKDPVVINAASAAVRQLVGCVFERVIQEDGVFNNAELTVVTSSGGRPPPRSAPPTLRPCSADAYMLFKVLHHPTECEIFLSSLMKFVDVDRKGWQRALSLEALHRVIVRPDIVRLAFCCSPNVFIPNLVVFIGGFARTLILVQTPRKSWSISQIAFSVLFNKVSFLRK